MTTQGQSWLADLAEELVAHRPGGATVITIPDVVRECKHWSSRAPQSAWDRRSNAASLLADWESAVGDAGPAMRQWLSDSVERLDSCLRSVASAGVSERVAGVSRLGVAAQEVSSELNDATARIAAWRDVIDASTTPEVDLPTVRRRVELLCALVDLSGADPQKVTMRMSTQLAPPPALVGLDPDVPHEASPDDDRLAVCADIVAAQPSSGRCVAWLMYGDARLAGQYQNVGPVFLIEADWAIPTAVEQPGRDFPHRAELLRVLEAAPELRDRDFSTGHPYEVLARVDLGHRPTYRALNAAEETIEVVLGVMVNRSGAPSWRREALSCLLRDDAVESVGYGPHGRSYNILDVDHYGQNSAAEAIRQYGPDLGRLLSAGPLPTELSEALRLIGEAGQVDSRENALRRTATIAEQTAVVLQASAVEHIASFGGVRQRDQDAALIAGWPMARWRQHVLGAVMEGLHGLGGGMNPVFQDVAPRGLEGPISLKAAYSRRHELIAATPRRMHRATASRLLSSIGDATTCARVLMSFEEEARLLNARLRRCRNALVHGNPVETATVASVRGLSRYKADSALELAIRSVVSDASLKDLLDERLGHVQDERARIEAGASLHAIWS